MVEKYFLHFLTRGGGKDSVHFSMCYYWWQLHFHIYLFPIKFHMWLGIPYLLTCSYMLHFEKDLVTSEGLGIVLPGKKRYIDSRTGEGFPQLIWLLYGISRPTSYASRLFILQCLFTPLGFSSPFPRSLLFSLSPFLALSLSLSRSL